MKKILFVGIALILTSCGQKQQQSSEQEVVDSCSTVAYNAYVERSELLFEGEELHEVFIITNDSAVITNHCDDCRYCNWDNPEGNPD